MNYIKYIILFLIFVSSTLVGRFISKKYYYRLEELEEFKNALNIFKSKIKFTYEPISEIFCEIINNTSKNVGKVFNLAKDNLENNNAQDAWIDAVKLSENNLTDEDKKVLQMFGKLLGQTDVEGQISQIDITQEMLDKQIQEALILKQKNEKLYNKLGATIGLAIVILLI